MGFCSPATFIFFNIQYKIKISPNNSIIIGYTTIQSSSVDFS